MRPIRLPTLIAMTAWIGLASGAVLASDAPAATEASAAPSAPPAFDAELAARHGADERGMRRYVLVVLKTGPTRVPDGEARTAMFAGHFANMERLAKAGSSPSPGRSCRATVVGVASSSSPSRASRRPRR